MTAHLKLVRDNIPDIIHDNGETCISFELSDEDFDLAIATKTVEEAQEVLQVCKAEKDTPQRRQQLIKELADLQEAVDTLMRVEKIYPSEVYEAQEQIRKERGGFTKKIFLVSTHKKP